MTPSIALPSMHRNVAAVDPRNAERPYEPTRLRLEWTRDPQVLEDVAALRHAVFARHHPGVVYPAAVTRHDLDGHVCVARLEGGRLVGACRVNVARPDLGERLPMEMDGFDLDRQAPRLRVPGVVRGELGALFVDDAHKGAASSFALYAAAGERFVRMGVTQVAILLPPPNFDQYRAIGERTGWRLEAVPEADCSTVSRKARVALMLAVFAR